jgi:hypothetical protein
MELSESIKKIFIIFISIFIVGVLINAEAAFTNVGFQNISANISTQNSSANSTSVDTFAIHSESSYQSTVIPDPWGYGYFTHPSVIWSSIPIFGHDYWMSITPYPYVNQSSSDNQSMETPCLYYSDNGLVFKNVSGIKNPFEGTNLEGYNKDAYGSDPEAVYCPDKKQMYCYYVVGDVFKNFTIEDVHLKIYNGKNLSKDYRCSNVSGISPAVLYDNKSKKFYMWIVDINYSPHQLMRYDSEDGINFTNKTFMDMSKLYKSPWHLDVRYNEYDNTYYMFLISPGCHDLWLAAATNITDTFVLYQRDPIVSCANITDNNSSTAHIYRSSGVFKGKSNTVGLWIPAQRESDNIWHIVYVTAEKIGHDWKYVGKDMVR